MKKRAVKYAIGVILIVCGSSFYSLNANFLFLHSQIPEIELIEEAETNDTIPTRYPVAKTIPENYEDFERNSPADLRNPENLKTTVEYDIKSGMYIIYTRIGDMVLGTPISLSPEEYQNYSMQQSIRSYFRQKNEEEFMKEYNKDFNITDMQFDIGPAEKIFGPGGVRVRTQGSADITLGVKRTSTKNPTLPQSARNRTFFNFDERVQLNVQASVGSKVNFDMNYNTETSFDFDSKKLKLAYTGEEDEIIKSIEAGNVSMTTSNSLINGGAALFGMKADLQFGKLRVNALLAQQNSESRTVNSKGGVQTKDFEITVDQYDENRHFFLAHYFRDNYDDFMKNIPVLSSGIEVTRIEIWVTNRTSNYEQSRNIVAFSDLGETDKVSNSNYYTRTDVPYNNANQLYRNLIDVYSGARDISQVTRTFEGVFEKGREYENVQNARLLDASEYILNKNLGYVSLRSQLQDEVLAVAFEYRYQGKVYQVGEFSTDDKENTSQNLYLKLLKGTSITPGLPYWDLMMKNIYSLGAYSVQKDKFRLDIQYQSDTTGTYINYIPEGNIANQILLRVMNLDRLNLNEQRYPDGFFDFLEGLTINSETGRVIFPVVEPFGSHLRQKIGNSAVAEKYVYQELYDTTLVAARQIAEKNKFVLKGEYKASSAAEIQLGASNVARGSVRVVAGGVDLTENVDYTVDYISGVVTILNENIINSGTNISVTLENQSVYSMQRKTMMGLDLNYEFNKNLTLGGTIMHLSEMPLTTKTTIGDESLKNTLWGLNLAYRNENQWLTNALDKIPLLNLTKPSQITFNAEFAHLIAGHYENKYTGGYSYLDDFESAQSGFDLTTPTSWQISSTPYQDVNPLFPEASLIDDIQYGNNRALLAWYYVDGMFTRRNSSLMPSYIKNSNDLRSDHYSRAVTYDEIYPGKQQGYTESSTLQVLNVAYYPKERGPYNLDLNVNADGTLQNPEDRWGGMMRRIEQTNFENANVEYLEFWLLDPFIYNEDRSAKGGDLYFNLGDISEDILKDEKKFYENGLPIDGDTSKVDKTVWGYVPKLPSTVYAFDNTSGAREIQDVGLNGLSSEQEKDYPAYKNFLEQLQSRISGEVWNAWQNDPLSVVNDPAQDNFRHYRNQIWDEEQVDILTRYKRYNGTEGNSQESSNGRYDESSKSLPDVEDLNQNNTLDDKEKYYEYKVSLRPEDMVVGSNFIVNSNKVKKNLPNGDTTSVTWYQFKIPIREYDKRIGNISDFSSIRFLRMYMTKFAEPTFLRFGTLQLVRGEWRAYEQSLSDNLLNSGTLSVSAVNIEENGRKEPVNYVTPPGVSRMLDPGQPQLVQQNEQSLSMKITNLESGDAKAVYKTMYVDLRQYKRMQLFTHAEALATADENFTQLEDGNFSVFIRLGSDYKNNYYEYQVPLKVTPAGQYSDNSTSQQYIVWPEENLMNFRLAILTDLKQRRNRAQNDRTPNVSYNTVFPGIDPDNEQNQIFVVGNPSLSEVKVIMIGVRNTSTQLRSGEVWVNELRLSDFEEDGGWAANASMSIALSDLGTVNLGGRIETAGFGGLDQSLQERRLDDYTQYNISTSLELGKLFPEKAKVSIPFYYAYSKEETKPKYNPLDQDILLKDAMDALETKHQKDSLKQLSLDQTVIKSIAVNNVKVDIQSKTPMPYDPANFSVSYSYSEIKNNDPETEYETTKDYYGSFAYNYTPYVKPWRPFEKIKKNNGSTRYLRQFSLNYVPSNISFLTYMKRNYYELQLRDLAGTTGNNEIPVSFKQEFYWDRAFSMRWDFTNNLMANFTSGTNARIEEPYRQVNKKLNPDDYQVWKDSVMQSLKELGQPLAYDQTFNVTYNLPLQYIPVLDWINSTATYKSSYTWDRGAQLGDVDSLEIGNVIQNQREWSIQANVNMVSLYNKNKFLKSVNQKYSSTRTTNTRQTPKKRTAKFEKEVTLSPDSGTVVQHGLFSKKLKVTARGANGKLYSVKYKPLNYAQILILNEDTATLNLTIVPGPPKTEEFWYKAAEQSARFLMMLRRFTVTYTETDGMILPGFREEIGDIFGQRRTGYGMSPGLDFAFGAVNKSFITRADERGWLVTNMNSMDPAVIDLSRNMTLNANLEPLPGLKIDLTGTRLDSRNTQISYMYDGMPEQYGGNFTITTIGVASYFGGIGDAKKDYSSKAYDKFLSGRTTISRRLDMEYTGMRYPNKGFINDLGEGGNVFDSSHSLNSTEALIPAFLAAYTGKDPKSISLSAFPSLSSMLPNWRITYDGLVKVPVVKKYFKTLMLSHQYRGSYSVGGYSSYANWVSAGNGDLGFIPAAETTSGDVKSILPSSPYIISSVTITDGFTPLVGVDGTLLNNVTLSTQYRTNRTLNLNINSYQIVESHTKEYVVGVGYKWPEFNKVLKRKQTRDFSNDLTMRLDFSYRKTQSLIRKFAGEDISNQLTSGNVGKMIQFSADYGVSRALTFRAFYDMQINTPLVSSTSYPTTNTSAGVTIIFSLAQ